MANQFPKIQTADIDWQCVDGVEIPISKQFGDVYFSKANGLLESRHVFINGNELPSRLSQLRAQQFFCVAETGFGTGLNFLALWQLWRQIRPDNHSHLHFISLEKYPLSHQDLSRALALWPELSPLSTQLLAQYPQPLAGCHRLHFADDRISLDLWFADAAASLPMISSQHPVDAWFLDGFAPSCNPELWQQQIFSQIMRLSAYGTTFASFSVAGVLKRALAEYGVQISRPKGFAHKREMLKAIWLAPTAERDAQAALKLDTPQEIAIIGAGIAGLNCAWAFAQRGITVTIYEQQQPLAAGSGNPLALLNPKLCPIEQVATHLMSCSWQYSMRFYRQFSAFRPLQVYQLQEKNIQQAEDICDSYPDQLLRWQQSDLSALPSSLLSMAGGLFPHQFAKQVLDHPLIQLKISKIESIQHTEDAVLLNSADGQYRSPQVIVCNALALHQLCPETVPLKPIRGQVSVASLNTPLSAEQLNTGFSYGGYALPIDTQQLVFGASFLPNQTETELRIEDHQHNLLLMQQALPTLAAQLADLRTWQGRASLRAQSPDYLPLVGQVNPAQPRIHCLAGLGSKGFMFAPLCSELLLSQILAEPLPVPQQLAQLLRPNRFKNKSRQAIRIKNG